MTGELGGILGVEPWKVHYGKYPIFSLYGPPQVTFIIPKTPYVGLRPFCRHDHLVFQGRHRDAALLRDKIFSARLTLFFGLSGTGKTSILQTLLIPYLEKENARIIYCDNWSCNNPGANLENLLLAKADEWKIPRIDGAENGFIDLLRPLAGADNKLLVLILDQFEEFFTHEHDPELLRQHLRTMVTAPNLEVRVLLSLREEHLANLEVFRADIPTLFQSPYRLEPLPDERAREAIEKPAKLFGMTHAFDLNDLIDDLRPQKKDPSSASVPKATVDLPILQLVCQRLWKETIKEDRRTITWDLYKTRLKGKQGIIDAHLREVLPQGYWNKVRTAKLMEYLAPADGRKQSYSAKSLARLAKLDETSVKTELDKLSDESRRLLRTRDVEGKSCSYELYHDSYIPIIEKWRDRILFQVKFLRNVAKVVGTGLLLFIIYLSVTYWNKHVAVKEYYKEANFLDEQKFDVDRFHTAVDDLLKGSLGNRSHEVLKDILRNYEKHLPKRYGIKDQGNVGVSPPDYYPVLYYPEGRDFDEKAFLMKWEELADNLSYTWGIPIPKSLELQSDNIHKNIVRIVFDQEERDLKVKFDWEEKGKNQGIELSIPFKETDFFIDEKNLARDSAGEKLLSLPIFKGDFVKFPEQEDVWERIKKEGVDGPWYKVPRWSLPAWKKSKVEEACHGSSLTAFLLADELQKQKHRMLTPEAADMLLDLAMAEYRETVNEARLVRGSRLVQDLREILKKGRNLQDLPIILDTLANYKDINSEEIAAIVTAGEKISPAWPQGPHKENSRAINPYRRVNRWVGYEGEGFLNPPKSKLYVIYRAEPMIRIFIGGIDLNRSSGRSEISHRLANLLHDKFASRIGVFPDITFEELPPVFSKNNGIAYKIAILGQDKLSAGIASIAKKETYIDDLSTELTEWLDASLNRVITTELVSKELEAMPSELQDWLLQKYSITDLKLLLREVVQPSPRKENLGNSIHQPGWLLTSLVFWSNLQKTISLQDAAAYLRKVQAARVSLKSDSKAFSHKNKSVQEKIKTGVSAMTNGRLARAKAAFAEAIKIDKISAQLSFPAIYAQNYGLFFAKKSIKLNENIMDRVELEELLQDENFSTAIGEKRDLRLKFDLLEVYSEETTEKRDRLAMDIWKRYGRQPAHWSPENSVWFVEQLVQLKDVNKIDPATIVAFLHGVKGLKKKEEKEHFDNLFNKLVKRCADSKTDEWVWKLLPLFWETRRDPEQAVKIANALVNKWEPVDIKNGLNTWLARARKNSQTLPAEEKARLHEKIDFINVMGLIKLHQLEIAKRHDSEEIRQLLLRLKESPVQGYQKYAYRYLGHFWLEANRFDKTAAVLDEALEKWPENRMLHRLNLKYHLEKGDAQGVAGVARKALDIYNESPKDPDRFYMLAVFGLLAAGTDDCLAVASDFLTKDDETVPLVAMMLSWRLARKDWQTIQKVLQGAWKHRQDWQMNCEGNQKKWNEMLLQRYLGQIDNDQLFSCLEDENSFSQSELAKGPKLRNVMLHEAYFYLALLADIEGNRALMISWLEKAKETKMDMLEKYIAAYLLKVYVQENKQ